MPGVVRAAGGLLVRPGHDGRLQVAVVYRDVRQDWTFPKGRLDGDESEQAAAVREVLEETRFHCELGRFLGRTRYRVPRGRIKTVAYWQMRVTGGYFLPTDEVQDLRWATAPEAAKLLTYPRDVYFMTAVYSGTGLAW